MRWVHEIGGYEFEVDGEDCYTGWYRCIGGRLADGRWPEWHHDGRTRYSVVEVVREH